MAKILISIFGAFSPLHSIAGSAPESPSASTIAARLGQTFLSGFLVALSVFSFSSCNPITHPGSSTQTANRPQNDGALSSLFTEHCSLSPAAIEQIGALQNLGGKQKQQNDLHVQLNGNGRRCSMALEKLIVEYISNNRSSFVQIGSSGTTCFVLGASADGGGYVTLGEGSFSNRGAADAEAKRRANAAGFTPANGWCGWAYKKL